VLDRASTFADPEIVAMLKTSFVPLAIDQAYQRRQKDAEGDFYRKIAGQGPRKTENFQGTTQGFYIATADGKMLLYNNNRDPQKVRRLMKEKLAAFQSSGLREQRVTMIEAGKLDPRFNVEPPEGGLVVRVRAKVLDGYEEASDHWRQLFQDAMSRDNLWLSKNEHDSLVRGEIPISVQKRIAMYHLVDNTRGEPPMWREEEIRHIDLKLKDGRLTGTVRLATDDRQRGYEAELQGVVETKNGKVVRFDAVVLGEFWGEGTFTRGAPKGKFPLGISFTLADGSDIADKVPPQGSRGWVQGYLR